MGSALAEGDVWIKFTVAYFGVFLCAGTGRLVLMINAHTLQFHTATCGRSLA